MKTIIGFRGNSFVHKTPRSRLPSQFVAIFQNVSLLSLFVSLSLDVVPVCVAGSL